MIRHRVMVFGYGLHVLLMVMGTCYHTDEIKYDFFLWK